METTIYSILGLYRDNDWDQAYQNLRCHMLNLPPPALRDAARRTRPSSYGLESTITHPRRAAQGQQPG